MQTRDSRVYVWSMGHNADLKIVLVMSLIFALKWVLDEETVP